MKVLTDDGRYLSGSPCQLVAQLAVRVCVGRAGQESLLREESARITRYQEEIGPAFAHYAAQCLLRNMEQDGYLLVCP